MNTIKHIALYLDGHKFPDKLADGDMEKILDLATMLIPIPLWVQALGLTRWFVKKFYKYNFAGRTYKEVLLNQEV